MRKSKIVMKKNKRGLWYFNLVSSNGKIICTSESYSSAANCKKGINATRKAAQGEVDVED